jgi:hypothetical protein
MIHHKSKKELEMIELISKFFYFKAFKNESGVSLIIALLILLVLTILGINAINTTTFETNIAGNERIYNNAFYAADSGIDYFYANINTYLNMYLNNPGSTIPQINSKSLGLNLGDNEFNILPISPNDIRVVDFGPPIRVEFKIISEGICPNFPVAGRVRVEAVIEALSQEAPQEYPGGST